MTPKIKYTFILISGLAIIAAMAYGATLLYAPQPPLATSPTNQATGTSSPTPPLDKATLCSAGAFTPPLQEELGYSREISKDTSVKYLRTAIDAYLKGTYTQGNHAGLLDGIHSPDSAYNELRQMDEVS